MSDPADQHTDVERNHAPATSGSRAIDPGDSDSQARSVSSEVAVVQAAIEALDQPLPPTAAESTEPEEPPFLRFDCTRPASDTSAAAEAARRAVERGELVVLPTDTVYGIGADAFNPDAVQRLLDAKIRGRDMPPPVLIAEPSLVRALAMDIPRAAEDLVAKHWPGPLTVIFQARSTLLMDLGDTEGTVALRVPDHELARELLRRTGPLAVSSANITSLPAALTCDEAIDQLGDNVAVYLDGGALGNGAAASTIVDFSQDERGEVLRHGALSLEVLRETLPEVRDLVEGDPATEAAVTPSTVESDAVDAPVADDEVEPAQLADQELVRAPLSDQEAVSAGDAVPTERPPER